MQSSYAAINTTAYKILKYSLSQNKNVYDPVGFDKAICPVPGSCFRIYFNTSYQDREHHYKTSRVTCDSIFDWTPWTFLLGISE